jgi:putative flippase GtrA
MARLIRQGMIYAAVGLAATAVHLLAALLLHSLAGFGPLSANAAAFALAWSVSYAGNHLLTFEAGAKHRQAMPRFIVVSGIGFALNQSLVWLLVEVMSWPFWLALVPVVIIVPLTGFVLSRRWAFKPAETHPA